MKLAHKIYPSFFAFFLLVFSMFFHVDVSYAQTSFVEVRDQVKDNTREIKTISETLPELRENYRLLYDGAKDQNDQLSDQISSLQNFIEIASGVFALLGFILGFYVTTLYKNIKRMSDMVTKATVATTDKLYRKVHRSETIGKLERLMEVPEDIGNISQQLLSRELLEEDFLVLKEIYLKAKNNTYARTQAGDYLILFFQHFPLLTLKDADLKVDALSSLTPRTINQMFERDVKNFISGLFKFLGESGTGDTANRDLIKFFFPSLFRSKFTSDVDLKSYIRTEMTKNNLTTTTISAIALEQAPADSAFTTWLDSVFQ